eukprot:595022-Pleurochrysis_carterae.AAC.1
MHYASVYLQLDLPLRRSSCTPPAVSPQFRWRFRHSFVCGLVTVSLVVSSQFRLWSRHSFACGLVTVSPAVSSQFRLLACTHPQLRARPAILSSSTSD